MSTRVSAASQFIKTERFRNGWVFSAEFSVTFAVRITLPVVLLISVMLYVPPTVGVIGARIDKLYLPEGESWVCPPISAKLPTPDQANPKTTAVKKPVTNEYRFKMLGNDRFDLIGETSSLGS
jgi:hypothetical protein